jgi:phosphoribosylamine--glycine ligase
MRFLAIGSRVYLGDMYLSLQREGHEIRVFASDTPDRRAFGGIIETVSDWRAHLAWVGRDGIILFEGVDQGAQQDALRAEGYRVIGGSALGDRLERERDFGQQALAGAGLPVAWNQGFDSARDALAYIEAHPDAYVLKYDDGRHTTFVGEHPRGADVAFMLRRHGEETGRVLLMERLRGVEVGIGAYFDGHRFLRPACIDFEHKRFFPGDMGEMTGEMGTLASYEGSERLFEATLGRVAPLLEQGGHVGYVNLNLIVDERGPFPLEFTCRFGNPGFAVLAAMQADGWADLFIRMAAGEGGRFRTVPGWSVAIVLTVPPFPAHTDSAPPETDPPIFYIDEPGPADLPHYHFVDMRRDGQRALRVHRRSGHAMIVTATGPTIAAAQQGAARRAANVIAPELRWRNDIGQRFVQGEGETLRRLGWM